MGGVGGVSRQAPRLFEMLVAVAVCLYELYFIDRSKNIVEDYETTTGMVLALQESGETKASFSSETGIKHSPL